MRDKVALALDVTDPLVPLCQGAVAQRADVCQRQAPVGSGGPTHTVDRRRRVEKNNKKNIGKNNLKNLSHRFEGQGGSAANSGN